MISIQGVKGDTSPDKKPLRKKYDFRLGDQAGEFEHVYAPKTLKKYSELRGYLIL